MIIDIQYQEKRIYIPVPTAFAAGAIRMIPDGVFESIAKKVPQEYRDLITRENFLLLYHTFKEILIENKGLEILHMERNDGLYVSITL